MSRLALLVCADIAVGLYLVAWTVETKLEDPYECDGLCQGFGVVAAVLFAWLAYATWRAWRRRAYTDNDYA